MQALGLEEPITSDGNALTRLQADMSFAGSTSQANMQDLVVKFDDSTFKGNLKIDNFAYLDKQITKSYNRTAISSYSYNAEAIIEKQ